MSGEHEPETDPTVPWYQRGGFTTIAMSGLVLGVVCWLAIGIGFAIGQADLVRGFVPFPAGVGLLLGLFGFIGPWRWVAAAAVLLCLGAAVLVLVPWP